MRTQEESQILLGVLTDQSEVVEKSDSFKYGLIIGKVMSLGWVLGEETSGEMTIAESYEGWLAELGVAAGDMKDAGADE